MKYVLWMWAALLLWSCEPRLENLPTFTDTRQVQAVVATPAGAGYQNKYSPETGEFQKVQEAGQDKVIRFLPWPVNAGFIPSTRQPKAPGSKNEPLSVVIIAGSQEPGSVMEIMPLGVLILEIAGEINYQVVATPAKPSERLLEATSYEDFSRENQAAKKILETWFLNYDRSKQTKIMGWKDERFAEDLIRKWMI